MSSSISGKLIPWAIPRSPNWQRPWRSANPLPATWFIQWRKRSAENKGFRERWKDLPELTNKGKKVVEIEYWADMRSYEKTREILYEEELEVMERLFENIATGLDEEKV